ncbi:Mu-like prophage major head subunit gpT family protein [Ectopseudomonas oleovorans]|uniref:Mu-like prophage major head subunit gpT family protein n=1 Tax=Ectopseudomonas oleovorans TaxID=301 RepID=UPI003F1D466B
MTPATKAYHLAACQEEGGLERFREFVKAAPSVTATVVPEGKVDEQNKTALNARATAGCADVRHDRRPIHSNTSARLNNMAVTITPALLAALFASYRASMKAWRPPSKPPSGPRWPPGAYHQREHLPNGWASSTLRLGGSAPACSRAMAAHGYAIRTWFQGTGHHQARQRSGTTWHNVHADVHRDGAYCRVSPRSLVFELLQGWLATECYDGQNFFDEEHPVYANTDGTGDVTLVSNMDVPAADPGPAWFLLDTTRAVKPLIFQGAPAGAD